MSCIITFKGVDYSVEDFKDMIKRGEVNPSTLLANVSYEDALIPGVTRDFKAMPFRVYSKLKSGLTYSLQPREYNMGSYKDPVSGKILNVFPMGSTYLEDFLAIRNITKGEFIKNYIGKDSSDEMKSFMKGDKPLYLHRIEEAKGFGDQIPDIDDTRFARLYDAKMNLIQKLTNELKRARGEEKKEILRERIKRLQEQAALLNKDESRNIDTLLDFIKNDMETVKNALDNKPDRRALEFAKSLIYNYVQLLTVDFGENIENMDEDTKLRAQSYVTQASALGRRIDNIYMSEADKLVHKTTGKSVVIQGEIKHTKDIGAIPRDAKDTTENPNIVVQVLTKIIKDVQKILELKYTGFHNKNKKIIKSLIEYQKNKGVKKEDHYDYMVQVDDKGNRTGNFVKKFSADYDKQKSIVRGTKSELLFYANNHKFKIDKAAWAVRRQNRVDYYKSHYSDNVILNDWDVQHGVTYEQKLNQASARWAAKADPEEVFRIMAKAAQRPESITDVDVKKFLEFKQARGFQQEKVGDDWTYVMEMRANDDWIDPKWKEIQAMSSTDPRKIFYDHWLENINKGRKILSEEEDVHLPWSYIPEKTKDLGAVGGARQWITNNISQTISQNIHGVDPLTGEIDKKIPVYMMDNRISPENKSYDLGDVLDNFMKEVINYEEKSKIEDDANMLLHLLSQQKIYETNPDGSIKMVMGKPRYKDGVSNNYLMAKYRLNAQLYDERQDKEMVSNIKKRDVLVQKELKEIKDKIDKLALNTNEKAEALSHVKSGIAYTGNNQKIHDYITYSRDYTDVAGQFKYITGNKVANTLMYYTSVKLLGLNLFGGFAEMLQGAFSLFTESAAKRNFNDADAARGMGRVFKSMTPWGSQEKNRIRNLSIAFNAQGKVFQEGEQNNIVSKIAYWQWEQANFLMNNSFLFAVLEHETAEDITGRKHKLADVLNVDDDMHFTWKNNIEMKPGYDLMVGDEPSPYVLDLMHKFKEVLKNNRERQTFEDPILLEKTTLGRIAGQFKKNWLFRAFYSRFGDYKEADLFSQQDNKGFYRSFFDLFVLPKKTNEITGEEEYDTSVSGFASTGKKIMLNWIRFSKIGSLTGNTPQGFSELDEANLRKFMREVSMVMTITLVILCMSATGGDDDRQGGRTYIVNQIVRLQRDLSTYMSPSSLASIIKNPFPIMSTLMDFSRIMENTITGRYIFDPYTNAGKKNESLRVISDFKKNVPFVNQIDRLTAKFNKQMTYNY